ncbi:hypothetical protein AB0L14_23615 [Streptomyces sp. NPDC052727]|uniref:hypothetical protein n=1 Tax=Streptomyces sp. NPDC052727 TaxID=3154854 RepID=UPI0034249388
MERGGVRPDTGPLRDLGDRGRGAGRRVLLLVAHGTGVATARAATRARPSGSARVRATS